jgi:ribosomal protein S25
MSAAKDFLEQLEANGTVQLVSGSHNIKIYKPVAG